MKLEKFLFKIQSTWWSIEWRIFHICAIIGHKLRCLTGLRRIETVVITYNNEEYGSESIHAMELDFKRLSCIRTGSIVSIKGAGKYFGVPYNSDADRREVIIDLRNPSIIDLIIYREGDKFEN